VHTKLGEPTEEEEVDVVEERGRMQGNFALQEL
jgi:hypothetical protein